MIILDNVTVADQFPNENTQQPAAIMFPAVKSAGGYFTISNNPVYLQLAYNIAAGGYGYGQSRWTKAIPFPTGPGIILPGTVGLRFKNYTPGSNAVVSGSLSEEAEPSIAVTSSGAFSSSTTVIVPNTILPGSPTDGQQAILWDSGVAPTYQWLMQWNAALGRWICIGGIPFLQRVEASAGSTAGNNVWQDETGGPTFTCPRAGNYLVKFGGQVAGNSAASTSYHGLSIAGSTPPLGGPNAFAISFQGTAADIQSFETGAIAINSIIKAQFNDQDSTRRNSISARWLEIIPVYLT